MEIKCNKCQNIFKQTPHSHLHGKSVCNKCSDDIKNEEWIAKVRIVHNDLYSYTNTRYINSTTHVEIICKTHGPFKQLPKYHIKGSGCAKCLGKHKYTTDEWIIEAKKIHGEKYIYSNVIYISCEIKVDIICPIHGIFSQTPNHHLRGAGCSKCGFENLENIILQKKNLLKNLN